MIPVDGSLLSRPLERYQPGKLCCEMLGIKTIYTVYIYIVWHYIYKRIHSMYIYIWLSCWPLTKTTVVGIVDLSGRKHHFIFQDCRSGSPNATDPSLVNPHLGGDSSEVQESPELRTVTAKTSNSPYHVNLKPNITTYIYITLYIYMYNMYKPSLYHHLQALHLPQPLLFFATVLLNEATGRHRDIGQEGLPHA